MPAFSVVRENKKWKVTVWWSPSSFDVKYCEKPEELITYLTELVGITTDVV